MRLGKLGLLAVAALAAAGLAFGIGSTLAPSGGIPSATAATVTVWKSASCGCCGAWVDHMREAGYAVQVIETDDLDPVREAKGVPAALGSCHTATVGGYVLEGHVPAADVARLLAEKPQARGLAVPGMPQSAPGMDIPGEPYEVVLFGTPGGVRLFARH